MTPEQKTLIHDLKRQDHITADEAIYEIERLTAELAEARAQVAAMETGDWSDVRLVRFADGKLDISAGPVPAIAEYLAQMMEAKEGEFHNYMAMEINHPKAGPMELTLQRKFGKTPHELKVEAVSALDAAKAEARREALKEAAAAAFDECIEDRSDPHRMQCAILALIEKEPTK